MSSAPQSDYPLPAERIYGTRPARCRVVDVLIIGSAIGLAVVRSLLNLYRRLTPAPLRVAVVDVGRMDILTHMAHTKHPRGPFLKTWDDHFGGRLGFWGMSTPRPPDDILRRWPYDYDGLLRRFRAAEVALGVPDSVP